MGWVENRTVVAAFAAAIVLALIVALLFLAFSADAPSG
jgi:hypothetical protein